MATQNLRSDLTSLCYRSAFCNDDTIALLMATVQQVFSWSCLVYTDVFETAAQGRPQSKPHRNPLG